MLSARQSLPGADRALSACPGDLRVKGTEKRGQETFKSFVTSSLRGFKYLALTNGGAVVALLVYMGNSAGKVGVHPDVRPALKAFCAGLLCDGVALFCSHRTRLLLLAESGNRASFLRSHRLMLYCSMLFYILGLVAFGIGVLRAVDALM